MASNGVASNGVASSVYFILDRDVYIPFSLATVFRSVAPHLLSFESMGEIETI
jgi:hypothetical protein